MLVLSRRCRESVVLPADGVTIRVLEIRANRVRLGIEAPSGVSVLRGELLCDVEVEQQQQEPQERPKRQGPRQPAFTEGAKGGQAGGAPLRRWSATARAQECAGQR